MTKQKYTFGVGRVLFEEKSMLLRGHYEEVMLKNLGVETSGDRPSKFSTTSTIPPEQKSSVADMLVQMEQLARALPPMDDSMYMTETMLQKVAARLGVVPDHGLSEERRTTIDGMNVFVHPVGTVLRDKSTGIEQMITENSVLVGQRSRIEVVER